MARVINSEVELDGIISAKLMEDGSLIILSSYEGTGVQWSYHEEVTIGPEGVKILRDLLTSSDARTPRAPDQSGDENLDVTNVSKMSIKELGRGDPRSGG